MPAALDRGSRTTRAMTSVGHQRWTEWMSMSLGVEAVVPQVSQSYVVRAALASGLLLGCIAIFLLLFMPL